MKDDTDSDALKAAVRKTNKKKSNSNGFEKK